MVAVKKSAGVASEMNLMEHTSHTPLPSANKAAYSGFETHRKHHQKSKTGVSVAHNKDMCPPKSFKKTESPFQASMSFPIQTPV